MADEKINKAPCFLKYLFIFLCFVLLVSIYIFNSIFSHNIFFVFNNIILYLIKLMAAGIFIQTLIYKSELESYNIYLEQLYTKPVMFLLIGSVILEFVGLFGMISAVKNWQPGIIIVNKYLNNH